MSGYFDLYFQIVWVGTPKREFSHALGYFALLWSTLNEFEWKLNAMFFRSFLSQFGILSIYFDLVGVKNTKTWVFHILSHFELLWTTLSWFEWGAKSLTIAIFSTFSAISG